jgi:hypothetical protein
MYGPFLNEELLGRALKGYLGPVVEEDDGSARPSTS